MSDFSDEYFSRARDALVPAPKVTDRDVSNRALRLGDQYQPRTEVVDSGGTFTAADEWIQCITLAPGQVSGFVRLLAEGGGFYAGDEPFYVSGPRIFTVDTGGQVLVQRAVRRELLSRLSTRDYPNNGAAFSDLTDLSNVVTGAMGAGTWAVLGTDEVFAIQATGANANGDLFGASAPDENYRGRYYELEYSISASVGNVSLQLVSQVSGAAYGGAAISQTGPVNWGVARIGDDVLNVINAPAHSVSTFQQAKLQNLSAWTVALVPNTAGAVITVAKLKVRRQGF